ncbi:MAG: HipA family kinase [Pseudomonadota bacterium]
METVELATLLGKPQRISDLGNVSPLWKANVIIGTLECLTVWMKKLSAQQLLAECVCAVIGRSIGMPIPRPFLVYDEKGFAGEVNSLPFFAMEDAKHPSVRRWLARTDDPVIWEALLRWASIQECALFDEWVANIDRNQGNLLYDGVGDFMMIDHAHALGGASEPYSLPHHTDCVRNIIADWLLPRFSVSQNVGFSESADKKVAEWQSGLVEMERNSVPHLYGMEREVQNVSEFLRDRLPKLRELIDSRAGVPRLGL